MKKVLFVATVVKTHINVFHLPYLKMFKEKGYEVHVAAKNDFIDEPCIIPNCDKHYDIKFSRSPFSTENITAYKTLKKIVSENDYEIIHCHTPVASVLTRIAARDCYKTQVIYTAHGFHFFKGAPLINWLIYYPVEKFCARYTDKLITINKEDYERVKTWSFRKNGKAYYVPGVGIDTEKIKNVQVNRKEKRRELGITDNNTKVLLSVGELNINKNHEAVIKAVSILHDENLLYLICGRGELKDYLIDLAEKYGMTEKVKLLGYRKDIAEILKASDLFIFPSKREGLPVALMEAMAAGVPCIASDVRGNRDLLSKELLFKPDDVDAIKTMIEKHLSNERENEITFQTEQYSLRNILEHMEEIYE